LLTSDFINVIFNLNPPTTALNFQDPYKNQENI